jgi:hypothetical protein
LKQLTDILAQNLFIVVVALAVVAVVALVIAAVAASRLRIVSRRFAWATGGSDSPDTLGALLKTVEGNRREIGVLKASLAMLAEDARQHFRWVGLVRYDAFEGVAGQQSYSLCLLDDHKNGVLLSNLVGREFTRSYAVEIKAGQASRKLGDEEVGALTAALDGARSARSSSPATVPV